MLGRPLLLLVLVSNLALLVSIDLFHQVADNLLDPFLLGHPVIQLLLVPIDFLGVSFYLLPVLAPDPFYLLLLAVLASCSHVDVLALAILFEPVRPLVASVEGEDQIVELVAYIPRI